MQFIFELFCVGQCCGGVNLRAWLCWINAGAHSAACAAIAQLGERQTEGLKVPGSVPCLGIILSFWTNEKKEAQWQWAIPKRKQGCNLTNSLERLWARWHAWSVAGVLKMHQPGIEPGSHRWQRCILPLDHWCLTLIHEKMQIKMQFLAYPRVPYWSNYPLVRSTKCTIWVLFFLGEGEGKGLG